MEISLENLQFYPPTTPSSTPPISALDMFLTDETQSLKLQLQSDDHTEMQMGSGFGEEFYGLPNPWLLPGLHSDHDYSGVFFCDDHDFHGCNVISNNTHEIMSHGNFNVQEKPENGATSETSGRVRRRPFATSLVKRKWTEDEDRVLVNLVEQYGVKKWACIAQKLEGRTAKQCRERWQNHLRPDIKKDSWSEEEEKMFVEAHEKLGNRWSEIAKRIPGRTENTVKNHWNAAKRRRNQERVSKKKKGISDQNLPKPSSLLQDYIKRNNLYVVNTPHNKSSQDPNINDGNETISTAIEATQASSTLEALDDDQYEYYYSPLITDIACDDEVKFMLNLFNDSHQDYHQPLGLQPPPMFSHCRRYSSNGDSYECIDSGEGRRDLDLIELVSSSHHA